MSQDAKFAVGETVRLRSAPDQVGRVYDVRWNDAANSHTYTVDFPAGRRGIFEKNLELVAEHTRTDTYAGAEAFQTLITFERLVRPPSRVAATFGTARASFYPYQFKPLLKLLESGTNRVLIADDVGLGKTIEAGYILRELRARSQALDRVLIVVPARLRYKWKEELSRRFDEEFELVRRADFTRLFATLRADREPPRMFWITSYESVRSPSVIAGFREFRVPLDLVVLDEAHKVRNTETDQHRIARELAESSEALVFLTATPVQTGLENLFNLLRLLEPQNFDSWDAFRDQHAANVPVVRALNALQQTPPNYNAAEQELQTLSRYSATRKLLEEPFFASIKARLSAGESLGRAERVGLQRDIGELSLFGHIISRTRKVDVLPNRPQRRAQAVRVALTNPEGAILADLAGAVSAAARRGWGDQMRALMDFRYAASSIPGALRHFRKRAQEQARGWDAMAAQETEDDRGWFAKARPTRSEPDLDPSTSAAATWVAFAEPSVDSKWNALEKAFDEVWAEDAREGRTFRKIVVFSFFRQTLLYLTERLQARGATHRVIAGWVSMEEREKRIADFLERDEVRVLLSSEVGSEGLDLQRACVVVNYDLPWNPMVVEQRIGRLDRIGQKSATIKIVNLITRDSIEERILSVLYERIRVFEDAIGDLEEILGDTVEDLVVTALCEGLTPDEQERRANQTADVLHNRIVDARQLQRRTEDMLAADQAFLDEIIALVDERRVPDPKELYRFLRGFYRSRYRGARLPECVIDGVTEVEFPSDVAADLEATRRDVDGRRVAGRIYKGAFLASLDQEAVLDHPRAELITLRHPLVRLAVEKMADESHAAHRRFAVRLRDSVCLDPGTYAFDLRRFEIAGLRSRVDLIPFVYDFQRERVLEQDVARRVLSEMIGSLEDNLQTVETLQMNVECAREELEAAADDEHARLDRTEGELNRARASRMRGMREGELNARIDAAERRLLDLRANRVMPVAIRLQEGQLQAAKARLDEFKRTAAADVDATCDMAHVADGVLIVD